MDANRICHMAEQIARNFTVNGEDAAIAATLDHIRLYWDARMKEALIAADQAAMSPTVAAVAARLIG